jgi:hypothetical protein
MSAIETILGWVEWIALVAIGIEIILAAWKIATEHNLDEGFRKIILATAGGVLILSLVNYFVPQVTNVIPSSVLSLPGANYLVDLAIAAFGIGAIYGGYLVAKGDLERGFEMIGLVAVMFILMASASSLFSSPSLPTNVALNNLTASGQSNGISLDFLLDLIEFATLLPSYKTPPHVIAEVDAYAGAIATIGLIILVVWRFLFDMETELMRYLVTIVKDIVIVAILISGALSIWNGFAEIVNGIITTMLNAHSVNVFLSTVIGVFIAWIGLAIGSGYFVPFVANLTAGLLEMSILALDLALSRYLIISAAVALAPVLAALWLWPPLRRVVEFVASFVLGMAIGGIIAAGAIYILANSGILSGLAAAFAPLTIGILPWIAGIAFGGIGASGGGFLTKNLPRGSSTRTEEGGSSGSVNLQNTKQQQIPQTTTLNRPTAQPIPQPSTPNNSTLQNSQPNVPNNSTAQPQPMTPSNPKTPIKSTLSTPLSVPRRPTTPIKLTPSSALKSSIPMTSNRPATQPQITSSNSTASNPQTAMPSSTSLQQKIPASNSTSQSITSTSPVPLPPTKTLNSTTGGIVTQESKLHVP